MEISQLALAKMWLYSFWLGGFLGVLHDLFQAAATFSRTNEPPLWLGRRVKLHLPLLRESKCRRRAHSKCLRQILLDLLLCLIGALLLLMLFYQMNNGKFRLAVLLCTVAGFACYRVTLSRVACFVLTWSLFILQAIVRYAVFFLLFPVRMLWWLLRYLGNRIYAKVAAWRRHKQRLHHTKKLFYNTECAVLDLTLQPRIKGQEYHKKKEHRSGAKKAI